MQHPPSCNCPECGLFSALYAHRAPKLTGKRAGWLRNALKKASEAAEALAEQDRQREQMDDLADFWLDCVCEQCEMAETMRIEGHAVIMPRDYCKFTQERFARALARDNGP